MRLRHLIKYCVSDGVYKVDKLEAALQAQFGPRQRLFDYSHSLNGTKVAVTGTLVSDAFPVVFSNYNGPGGRREDCGRYVLTKFDGCMLIKAHLGYRHVRPLDIDEEIQTWQA